MICERVMRGKFVLTPKAGWAHGLVRGNEGPSSLRGSSVAMSMI